MTKSSPQGSAKLTPMLAQYMEIKKEHTDAILLFRMGDFYETFFDDAARLADICGVTLTTRDKNSNHPVPLAGVPYHALDTYLGRLLRAGVTVAICEQVEDPALAKGLVRREVVEIISPGTLTAPELLGGDQGHYCLGFLPTADGPNGWAILDASTGEFRCGLEEADVTSLAERYAAREIIVPETAASSLIHAWRTAMPGIVINPVSAAWFHPGFAIDTLCDHFGVKELSPFGLAGGDRAAAAAAAGALLRYLTTLNLKRPAQVTTLQFASRGDSLLLDEETLRNLEVFRTFRGERGEGTLIHHLDATVTPMGRRLLERRLAEPLTDLDILASWHRGIDGAVKDRSWREEMRKILKRIGDLDRWGVRAASGRLGPAQTRQLGDSLRAAGEASVCVLEAEHEDHPAMPWARHMPDLGSLATRILDLLVDQPPAQAKTGDFIRRGIDPALDEAKAVASDIKGFLASLQEQERAATGITSLKVGFNKVFGYFFEVTNKHLDKVPEHYTQKQTLVNAARFHTTELKEAELTILEAEQRMQKREQALFGELLADIAAHLGELHRTAGLVASLDLLFAFAELAERRDYCRPTCDDSLILAIVGGRHPVVECLLDHDFIPNDTDLDCEGNQIVLLTGPNMGGKSTYLRQVALITLMAQAGSFVPARSARIGVADRIFTRVGAGDNVARGQSTFFAEMSETARILHQTSRRSLVILDEVGRGTSTYDGLSLAWAITEFLHHDEGPRPRTIFATHYHELTALEQDLPRLVNMRMDVKEWEGRIIFLHAVKPGCSDKSYGIHVARLAGVPEPVLRRAEALLSDLSGNDANVREAVRFDTAAAGHALAADAAGNAQLSLFSDRERNALSALLDLDIDRLSPVDAFMWLVRIRRELDDA